MSRHWRYKKSQSCSAFNKAHQENDIAKKEDSRPFLDHIADQHSAEVWQIVPGRAVILRSFDFNRAPPLLLKTAGHCNVMNGESLGLRAAYH